MLAIRSIAHTNIHIICIYATNGIVCFAFDFSAHRNEVIIFFVIQLEKMKMKKKNHIKQFCVHVLIVKIIRAHTHIRFTTQFTSKNAFAKRPIKAEIRLSLLINVNVYSYGIAFFRFVHVSFEVMSFHHYIVIVCNGSLPFIFIFLFFCFVSVLPITNRLFFPKE